jgi:hypothetical protein
MVEAARDHPDAPGVFAGCHRLDDTEPDIGRQEGRLAQSAQGIVRSPVIRS